ARSVNSGKNSARLSSGIVFTRSATATCSTGVFLATFAFLRTAASSGGPAPPGHANASTGASVSLGNKSPLVPAFNSSRIGSAFAMCASRGRSVADDLHHAVVARVGDIDVAGFRVNDDPVRLEEVCLQRVAVAERVALLAGARDQRDRVVLRAEAHDA